jgi:hypothetical protein
MDNIDIPKIFFLALDIFKFSKQTFYYNTNDLIESAYKTLFPK